MLYEYHTRNRDLPDVLAAWNSTPPSRHWSSWGLFKVCPEHRKCLVLAGIPRGSRTVSLRWHDGTVMARVTVEPGVNGRLRGANEKPSERRQRARGRPDDGQLRLDP